MSLRLSFESAHYRRHQDLQYGPFMVRCGVEALGAGHDSAAVVALAASAGREGPELLELFEHAAQELGLELPSPETSFSWWAEQGELADEDPSLQPSRTVHDACTDELRALWEQLRQARATSDDALHDAIVIHLGKFLGRDSVLWDEWLERLKRLCAESQTTLDARLAATLEIIVQVLLDYSYSVYTREHRQALMSVRKS